MLSSPDRITQTKDDFLTLQRAKFPLLLGHAILEVRGDEKVESVITADMNFQGQFKRGSECTWEVDAVCVSHGLVPNTHVCRALDCDLAYDPVEGSFYVSHDRDMATSRLSIYVAGEAAGLGASRKR
jgi:D-hydroxyproline dehydrogenase subunit alpha